MEISTLAGHFIFLCIKLPPFQSLFCPAGGVFSALSLFHSILAPCPSLT